MKPYSLRRIAFVVCTFFCCGIVVAEDRKLLDVVAQELRSPSNTRFAPYLDQPIVTDSLGSAEQKLKKLSAYGLTFSGRATLEKNELNSVSYWSDESDLDPALAEATRKAIALELGQQHGPAKIVEVPNYGDASEVRTQVMRWEKADELILLTIQTYPTRSSIYLKRVKRTHWLAEMGADEGQFWQATLQREAEEPKRELPKAPSPISDQSPPATFTQSTATPAAVPVTPSAPNVAEGHVPAVERRAPVWPWFVGTAALIVIVVIALKRRA